MCAVLILCLFPSLFPINKTHTHTDTHTEFVEKKLMKRLSRTVTALSEFEDSQAAFYLLRVSYSIVRAVHFMRTTPLEHWRDHAKSFDKLMRKAAETILGTPLP